MNLKKVLYAEDKIYKVKMRIRILWQSVFHNVSYGAWGKKSCIIKPIRILGKKHVFIGDGVCILNHSRIEAVTKWEEKVYNPKIEIQDHVSIGQNFHLTAANSVKIGKNSMLSFDVCITDIDHDYTGLDKDISKQELIVRETEIGENCFIGCRSLIQGGTKLGKHCVVGAHSIVRGEFPDYCVIAGAPARIIKQYNKTSKCWERIQKL